MGDKVVGEARGLDCFGGECQGVNDAAKRLDEYYTFNGSTRRWLKRYTMYKAAERDGALCLDGTVPHYYLKKGPQKHKWWIILKGGGYCPDLVTCHSYGFTPFGSSRFNAPKIKNLGKNLSYKISYAQNPLFTNWTHAMLQSCDAGAFSGSLPEPLVDAGGNLTHIRGYHILRGFVEELLERRGLDNATEVIFSGISSGAHALFLHCDRLAAHVRTRSTARVICIPNAGFFPGPDSQPDFNQTAYRMWRYYRMVHFQRTRLPAACTKVEDPPVRCFWPDVAAKYIKTEMFLLQSKYDSFILRKFLKVQQYKEQVNLWFQSYMQTLARSVLFATPHHRRNGVALHGCDHHGASGNYLVGDMTEHNALEHWYLKGPRCRRIWIDPRAYPCKDCCKKLVTVDDPGRDNFDCADSTWGRGGSGLPPMMRQSLRGTLELLERIEGVDAMYSMYGTGMDELEELTQQALAPPPEGPQALSIRRRARHREGCTLAMAVVLCVSVALLWSRTCRRLMGLQVSARFHRSPSKGGSKADSAYLSSLMLGLALGLGVGLCAGAGLFAAAQLLLAACRET